MFYKRLGLTEYGFEKQFDTISLKKKRKTSGYAINF